MKHPADSKYAKKLVQKLLDSELEQEEFLNLLKGGQSKQATVVWPRGRKELSSFEDQIITDKPEWLPDSCDLLNQVVKIGQTPEHEKGDIYSFDGAACFEGHVFDLIPQDCVKSVLDVCAAPGGKSMLAQARFSPRRLVANEVIGKRLGMLRSNIERCHLIHAEVMNSDPNLLAERYPEEFDLVIVDAPCSGQSLLAKGIKNPGCFHPQVVNKNAQRQKRIIANSVKCVKPGGYLAYMTCTFSPKENEEIIDWLLENFDGFEKVESPFGRRLYPMSGFGAGGFTQLLQKLSPNERMNKE